VPVPMSYVMVFFMFTEFRSEVIVHLVVIGGFIDHLCLIG
jgi:hypothetical protein